MVEHFTDNEEVGGSIPPTPTIIKQKYSPFGEYFCFAVLNRFVFWKNLVHATTADRALALGSFRTWAHLYDFNILHLPLGLAFHAMTFNFFIHKLSILII